MIYAYIMIIFIIFTSTNLFASEDMEVEEQKKSVSSLSVLPSEVIERILSLLGPNSLLSVLSVEKRFQTIGTNIYVEKYDTLTLGFKVPFTLKSPRDYHSLIASLQKIILQNLKEPNNSYFTSIATYFFPHNTTDYNVKQNLLENSKSVIDEKDPVPNEKVKVIDFVMSVLEGYPREYEQIYKRYSPKHNLSKIQRIYESLDKPYRTSLGRTSYFQGIPSAEECYMDSHYFMVTIPQHLKDGATFLDLEETIYNYLTNVVEITKKDKQSYLTAIEEKTMLDQDQRQFLEFILLERGFGHHFSQLSKEKRYTIMDFIRKPEHIPFNARADFYFPVLLTRGNFCHIYEEPEKILLALANKSTHEIFAQYEYAKIRFERDKSLKGEIATSAIRYGGHGEQCFIIKHNPELDKLFVILNLMQNNFRIL